MVDIKPQILHLFQQLSPTDKADVLAELNKNNSTISVSEFAQLVQRLHKKSISFDIRTDIENKIPTITAIVITPFGEFSAVGSNQAIAKGRAVQKAFTSLNNTK